MAVAQTNEVQALTKAFSGLGVDEKSFIAIGKWHPEQRQSFRKGTELFVQDERSFERWADEHVKKLTREFLRLKSAVVLWTMHPWERDARLIRDAVIDGAKSNNVIVEIACTRSSEELLGARRAYHSIFDRSIEEDVAYNADGVERKLLVALVSAYRYEGSKVHEDTAKSEAKTLCGAIRNGAKKNPMEDDDVVRILSTRSKLHLRSVFKHYKEMCGKPIDEELVADSSLKDAVQCISNPSVYFIRVLDAAMNPNADENTKEGLTRVIVTRADHDMKEITEEYHKKNGVTLTERIGQMANGNFKDFLLTLLARGGFK